jgi:hypothetical protein
MILPNHQQSRALVHALTHAHTHSLHQSWSSWKHRRKGSFGILRSLAFAFDLMSSMVAKRIPLRPFSDKWTAKSHSTRDPENTVVGLWQECFFSAKNCCTTCDVWLGALSWCRNHCPATCRAASSELHRATSAKFESGNDQQQSKRYELMVHQTIEVKGLLELFDCNSYVCSLYCVHMSYQRESEDCIISLACEKKNNNELFRLL